MACYPATADVIRLCHTIRHGHGSGPLLVEVHPWAHSLASLAAESHLGYNSAGQGIDGSWTVSGTVLEGAPTHPDWAESILHH